MKRNGLGMFSTIAILVLLAGTWAYAGRKHGVEQDEGAALAHAKVSLVQAVTAAEQDVQGKAVRAELEEEHGKWIYEVEVVNGNAVTNMKVDSLDGKILSRKADREDTKAEKRKEEREHEK